MNFDADKKTISTLLSSKKIYEIPRFQREFSWEKAQLEEFFNDIISRIDYKNEKLVTSEYFWGSTLFVGSFTDANCKSMQVVDGQQRITTITIYLSCIRKAFLKAGQPRLAELTQAYIMSTNDNGEEYAVLVNETPYPYFQNTVQSENTTNDTAVSDEEVNIKKAVDYFNSRLDSRKLVKFFETKFHKQFEADEILKALRDQLLNSVIIAISTQDKNQANMIFEILNAKGKSLDQIDLIKNQIFSVVKREQPSDEAKLYWSDIKNKLYSRSSGVDLSVFFNHFWTAKYGKTNYKQLFAKFKDKIKSNEETYLEFLNDLKIHADYYVKITNPKMDDFNNRVEYRQSYYYLSFLNDLNIKQSRILILTLFNLLNRENKLLSCTEYIRCLKNLCIFHLIYNGLYAQRTNILETLYSEASIQLLNDTDKSQLKKHLENLYENLGAQLKKIGLNQSILIDRISQLTYSAKTKNPDNLRTKFIIRMLYEIKAAYPTDASIEHIENESSEKAYTLNIGNLFPLEQTINSRIPKDATFKQKSENYYSESVYYIVSEFLNKHYDKWSEDEINDRAIDLAKLFIDNYFKDLKFIN